MLLRFSNQHEVMNCHHYLVLSEFVMVVRISFGLLIATSLALTAYFGATAWRLSSDLQNDGGWTPRFRMVNAP
ncbi:hypothetical protein [Bradyrhizobium sp. Tv2a-2]|uniref:hypothetical protein n=1 Tax=Bradyrhizobium sp. Tv2a-2 TaxID=113395 RepID=UPI0004656420|nr:hypothetical protein [Bradyrhizobium sp. Tv2a-2]